MRFIIQTRGYGKTYYERERRKKKMNNEIREIKIITLGDIFKNIETEDKAFMFLKYIKGLQNHITNLQKENEEIKVENEKLTQLWLNSQEKRRKAIEYLEQPYRDNFDYSKAELLNILQNGDDEE